MRINIPDLLLHLRGKAQELTPKPTPAMFSERFMFQQWARLMRSPGLYSLAAKLARWGQILLARQGWIRKLPMYPASEWTKGRDFPALAPKSFHDRWKDLRG